MSSMQNNDINLDQQSVEAVTALYDVLIEMSLECKKQRKEDSNGRHNKDSTASSRPDEN